MVDFSKPGVIIAGVTIGLFVFSMFAVLLSVPTGQDGQASPTPSVTPGAAFKGSGQTKAAVLSFSDQVLVQCDAPDSFQLSGVVENESYVQSAFEISRGIYAVSLNSSVASNDSAAGDALFDLKVLLYNYCLPRVLRKATAEFSEPVVLTNESGANKTVFPREISVFSSSGIAGSPGGVPVYVLSSASVNSTLDVLVIAQLSGDRLSQWFAQQLQLEVPRLVASFNMPVSVAELLPQAFAELDVPWSARGLNALPIKAQLNSSNLFALTAFNYSAENSVLLHGVPQNESEEYASFFRNHSFVTGVLQRQGSLVVFVQHNYTDGQALSKLVSQRGLEGNLTFPNSTLTASAGYDNATVSFQNVSGELKTILGPDALVLRGAVLAPRFRQKESRSIKIALPPVLQGRVSPETLPDEAFKLVEVRMLVQDQLAISAEGRENIR